MKRHDRIFARLLAIALLTSPSATLASWLPPKLTSLQAQVSVDATGHVTDVVLIEDKLSAAIKSTVVEGVKKWLFEPVLVDGTAVPAQTYVNLDACAIPSGGGYDLALHYVDNGPLLYNAAELELGPTIAYYSNVHQTIKVKLTVEHDGHAELQDVVMVDVAPVIQRDMHDAVKRWVKSMSFKPEQIGGKAVATDLEWPIYLVTEEVGTHHPDADIYADPTCKLARKTNKAPHSINSQLKRREEPALQDTRTPVD